MDELDQYLNDLRRLYLDGMISPVPSSALRSYKGALALAAIDKGIYEGRLNAWEKFKGRLYPIDTRHKFNVYARNAWARRERKIRKLIDKKVSSVLVGKFFFREALKVVHLYFRKTIGSKANRPSEINWLLIKVKITEGGGADYSAWQVNRIKTEIRFREDFEEGMEIMTGATSGAIAATIHHVATGDKNWDKSIQFGQTVGAVEGFLEIGTGNSHLPSHKKYKEITAQQRAGSRARVKRRFPLTVRPPKNQKPKKKHKRIGEEDVLIWVEANSPKGWKRKKAPNRTRFDREKHPLKDWSRKRKHYKSRTQHRKK